MRSIILLCGDNRVGKSALAAHWLAGLDPKRRGGSLQGKLGTEWNPSLPAWDEGDKEDETWRKVEKRGRRGK